MLIYGQEINIKPILRWGWVSVSMSLIKMLLLPIWLVYTLPDKNVKYFLYFSVKFYFTTLMPAGSYFSGSISFLASSCNS